MEGTECGEWCKCGEEDGAGSAGNSVWYGVQMVDDVVQRGNYV